MSDMHSLSSSPKPLLEVKGLTKYFPIKGGIFGRQVDQVHAVDGVSFDIAPGETLGMVGESGCGKSTTGRCILRLIEPSSGEVNFNGQAVSAMGSDALREVRRDMQIIFQDPFASLNPRMSVEAIIGEALTIHKLTPTPESYRARIVELLETVGLNADHMKRFPHEFSGGQRQRIGIARALAVSPKLIVCDEPVSALDVSVRADVMNLLVDLKNEFGLTYVFISHDLSMVRHISDEIAVMYLGRVVEYGNWQKVLDEAKHPYTKALISSIPDHAQVGKMSLEVELEGEVPSPTNIPQGCAFHVRCPIAVSRCSIDIPPLIQISAQHQLACPEVSK